MDLVIKLREARRISGLAQREVARRTGLSEKSISTWETGRRIDSLKVKQLEKLLRVYKMTPVQFFGWGDSA